MTTVPTDISQMPKFGMTRYEFAWIALVAGSFSFVPSSAETALYGELNAANIVRFVSLTVACCILLPTLFGTIRFRFDAVTGFLLYAIFCLISTIWSVAPIATAGKAVELTVATLVVFFVMNRPDSAGNLRRLLNLNLLIAATALVAIILGFIVAPEAFSSPTRGLLPRRLDTQFISANGIAYLAAISGTYALARIIDSGLRPGIHLTVYALSWCAAILAQGRTGLAALAIVSVLLPFRKRHWLTILLILLPTFVAGSALIGSFVVRGESVEMIYTLTGRTVLWTAGWKSFLENPWTGNGFGVGGRYVFLGGLSGFDPMISSLHSGFLEILTGVGIFGFLIWFAVFLSACIMALKAYMNGRNLDVAASFVLLVLVTVMSTGVGGWFNLPLGFFLIGTAILIDDRSRVGTLRCGGSHIPT